MPLSVPYNHHLDSSLEPGAVIVIKGTAVEGERITVNLSEDSAGYDSPNIVFQLTVRFDSDEVVMNAKKDGQWGEVEEKAKNLIKAGDKVDLRVLARPDRFVVMSQRKELCTFEHRMPLVSVRDVFVDGAISLNGVACGGKNLSLPYESKFRGPYNSGDLIYISGETASDCTRFAVNLYNEGGDSVLHFNPRFGEDNVVRNAKIGGSYGEEEKEGGFPFAKGTVFDIAVMSMDNKFVVYVNDVEFCSFAHRGGDNQVVTIGVEGELAELQTVDVLRS